MEKHHADSIANLVREFQADPGVLALLLGGSLAHGCARPDSDSVRFLWRSRRRCAPPRRPAAARRSAHSPGGAEIRASLSQTAGWDSPIPPSSSPANAVEHRAHGGKPEKPRDLAKKITLHHDLHLGGERLMIDR
ncbi:MAG: hypothetical protein ACOZE5_09405 [Verrucomicrobiota bacterium]